MKTQEQIEIMLQEAIDNYKAQNILFSNEASAGDCDIKKLCKIRDESTKFYHRIIAFKEVLNHK